VGIEVRLARYPLQRHHRRTAMTDATDRPRANWDWARADLTARRRQLVAQVVRVEDDLRWFESNVEPEQLEEGQEQALSTVLARLDEHDRAEIAAIDRALARIDGGEYGMCRNCHDPIPVPRQRALPATDLCRPCAERRAP
jgi:DnaK suppressor protein